MDVQEKNIIQQQINRLRKAGYGLPMTDSLRKLILARVTKMEKDLANQEKLEAGAK